MKLHEAIILAVRKYDEAMLDSKLDYVPSPVWYLEQIVGKKRLNRMSPAKLINMGMELYSQLGKS